MKEIFKSEWYCKECKRQTPQIRITIEKKTLVSTRRTCVCGVEKSDTWKPFNIFKRNNK